MKRTRHGLRPRNSDPCRRHCFATRRLLFAPCRPTIIDGRSCPCSRAKRHKRRMASREKEKVSGGTNRPRRRLCSKRWRASGGMELDLRHHNSRCSVAATLSCHLSRGACAHGRIWHGVRSAPENRYVYRCGIIIRRGEHFGNRTSPARLVGKLETVQR